MSRDFFLVTLRRLPVARRNSASRYSLHVDSSLLLHKTASVFFFNQQSMARKRKTSPQKTGSPLLPTLEAKSTPHATRAKFTAADDVIFVQVLKEQQAAGNQADNNWKGRVWTAVAAELNKQKGIGGLKNASGCKDHWNKVCHRAFNNVMYLTYSFS